MVQQAKQFQVVCAHFLDCLSAGDPNETEPASGRRDDDTPDLIRVGMTEVFHQLAAFDHHFLVPHFHLGQWNDFMPWLGAWWDCQSPVTSIWIYHDGAHRADGSGAAAVAFLHQQGHGWVFGGALSIALEASVTSYGAELRGGLLAVQFCIDLLKIVLHLQTTPPEIWLLHDNTAVGNQITGKWNANADIALAALLRHLTVYAEHRFRCRVQTQYVAAHRGDPGNELADALAGEAANGKPLADLTPWLTAITQPAFCEAAAWFWLLYSPQFTPWWTGSDLCLPAATETTPTSGLLPSTGEGTPVPAHGTFACKIATCNVLTLKTGRGPKHIEESIGAAGPTRQMIIFQQFKDAQVCIFALQETRLKRSCKSLLGYQIYKGSASDKGHHGVLIAISTVLPYGSYVDAHGKRRDLFFTANDISLIHADSRCILLRLRTPWVKCLLIAGHAPHSGYDQHELEQWWNQLGLYVPPSLHDWPILLLADANAKVGADACSCIGTIGAEEGTDKATPFTSFIRAHQIWLPSTFHCHEGPTGTWRHPSGKWTRNDYVGLPCQWQITACRSWVADDIDVSLHHEDHKAALVSIEMPIVQTSQKRTAAVRKIVAEHADLQPLRATYIAPSTDVHTHAAQLQDQVLDCLPRPQRLGPQQLKTTMSSTT
jgi:ribonuclease HI